MNRAPLRPDHGLALSKTDYDYIRNQLVFAPSEAIGAATLLGNAGLFGLALWLLADGAALPRWIGQAILPIVFFQAFSLLHDCGHGSFSARRGLNAWVGHYASVLCFMPYWPWKYVHAEHHVWAGNIDRDPGLSLLARARERGQLPWPLRLAWRTWLPLAALVQHVMFWTHPLRAARSGALEGARLRRCAASSLLLPAAYLGLHRLAPGLFNLANFGPSIVAYLVMVELVNLPHHMGLTSATEKLPLWKQHVATRSCAYPPVISELVVLNFNFHIEHHLFPNLPWYRLRKARVLVKRALGSAYREADGFGWHRESRRRPLIDVILAHVRPTRPAPTRGAPTATGAGPAALELNRGEE